MACDQVGRGVLKPPELFGNFAASIKEVSASQAYGSPLVSEKVSRDSRRDLVRAITAARLEGKGRRTTGEAAAAEAATNAAQAQTQADELEHLARRMAAGKLVEKREKKIHVMDCTSSLLPFVQEEKKGVWLLLASNCEIFFT